MKLGVRWYAPGELGEVLPALKTIPLPTVDETVRPDFPIRRFNVRFGVHGHELAMWAMRLGIRDPYGIQVAHGMDDMTHRDEILAKHPDWFALYGGKRHNQPGQRLNQLCYSNEELFQETVRYVRAQLDHYKLDAVSVMPPDGYTAICQCPLCAGQGLARAGPARPVVRLRLGFRQSRRQRGAQDAPGQEGPQLRLRRVHAAAAEDRQTGAERRRLDRRRPPAR